MHTGITRQKIQTGLAAIGWFVLFLLFLLAAPLMLQWSGTLFLGIVVFSALVGTGLFFLLRLLLKWTGSPVIPAIKSAFLAIGLVSILVTAPVYYISMKVALAPVMLPQAVITNGEKTVVFQGMVHVGAESFYKSVVFDLEEALSDGYTIFYEGVQPSPGEGDEWFSAVLAGGGSMDNNYQTLADICGVEFQLNYFGLMAEDRERNPERHVDADVTTLEMKREAERLALTNPAIAQAIEKALQGTEADTQEVTGVMAWLQQGSEGQRRIVGSLCRGVLAMTLGDNSGNALLPVILDFRNQALVDRILASEADKIYITYGAAHLLGILELLKNATPAWELVSVKWMQGVTVPVDYEGYLEI